MKKFKITPVIFCGGSGTRIWPLSRSRFSKQFLFLTGSDGAPRKWINSSKLNRLGWVPSVSLENGLNKAYQSFLSAQ